VVFHGQSHKSHSSGSGIPLVVDQDVEENQTIVVTCLILYGKEVQVCCVRNLVVVCTKL
jgi:hypothetical protein